MDRKPHQYQWAGAHFLVNRQYTYGQKGGGLFADPGLGKTMMQLLHIDLMKQLGMFRRALLVAPKRAIYSVWPQEIEKWGFNLTWSRLHGSKKGRAMNEATDLHLINPEGLAWYVKQNRQSYTDLIVDESTRFMNPDALCSKLLNLILPHVPRRTILTGTPMPTCYGNLYNQVKILDDGELLGVSPIVFRRRFMYKGGFQGRVWLFNEDRGKELEAVIAPLCLRMDQADYLDMPKLIRNVVRVELPAKARKQYKSMEEDFFVELDLVNADGSTEILAGNAGIKYAICRGMANGGFYENQRAVHATEDRVVTERIATHHIHEAKTEACHELIDSLGGKPVAIAYNFNHDLERLRQAFPKAPVIKSGVSETEVDRILTAWNLKQLPILLIQPLALSDCANMQQGGNDLIWYGMPQRPILHQQLNARFWRQGLVGAFRAHYLVAVGTVDEAELMRLDARDQRQSGLLNALRRYRAGTLGKHPNPFL